MAGDNAAVSTGKQCQRSPETGDRCFPVGGRQIIAMHSPGKENMFKSRQVVCIGVV